MLRAFVLDNTVRGLLAVIEAFERQFRKARMRRYWLIEPSRVIIVAFAFICGGIY